MGELFAALSALAWAVAVILFKRSGETVPPFAMNLFRVGLSSCLLLATMLVAGQAGLRDATARDLLTLAASGIVGIAVSDTFFHAGLNRIGAGLNAIVDCLYSPLVALFAFLMLDERLAGGHLLGMGLVIMAVLVSSGHAPPSGISRGRLAAGIVFAALAMVTVALGVVIAKPVLARHPVLWVTGVRQFSALAAMLPVALVSRRRREHFCGFRPRAAWRFTVPGTIFGSYLALMLWLGGMKHTATGIAAILNQTTTIYIILFATLMLGEPFTRRKLLACACAVAGALLVVLA